MVTIYMPLLDEGTDVWRPVEATRLTDDTYRIEGVMDENEEWAFAPGSVVRCGRQPRGLTAIDLAD
jgi:hypothetical protein